MTTINAKELLEQLKWVARFRDGKGSIPILRNIAFQNSAGGLNLQATDLEIGGTTYVSAFGMLDYPFTVPVDALLKYLPKVEESEIRVSVVNTNPLTGTYEALPEGVEGPEDNPARYTPELHMRIEHGSDGLLILDGISMDSYPVLPESPQPLGALYGLANVSPIILASVSAEESRFTLNGALFETKGGVSILASTDGRRLVVADVDTDIEDTSLLIPRKALSEVVSAFGNDAVTMAATEDHIFFSCDGREIITRKLSRNFPDYHRVLPSRDAYNSVQVDSDALAKLIERISPLADARSRAIGLAISGGKLSVSANQAAAGRARGHVAVSGEMPGETFASGFNYSYLLDFLKFSKGQTVGFHYSDSKRSAELSLPGVRYVVMPMRDVLDASNLDFNQAQPSNVPALYDSTVAVLGEMRSALALIPKAKTPKAKATKAKAAVMPEAAPQATLHRFIDNSASLVEYADWNAAQRGIKGKGAGTYKTKTKTQGVIMWNGCVIVGPLDMVQRLGAVA